MVNEDNLIGKVLERLGRWGVMTSNIDIYRSAKQLIDLYGTLAEIHAAQRADELLGQGDMDGRTIWLGIMAAIRELRRERHEVDLLH